MNREIKFRAWDGNRMIYFKKFSIGLGKGKKTKPYVYFEDDTFNGEVSLRSHQIMQWTGMVDSNNVDIYEGDIISVFNSEETKGEVIFDEGSFRVREDLKYYSHLSAYNPKTMVTVIGNIYQHPTILNE